MNNGDNQWSYMFQGEKQITTGNKDALKNLRGLSVLFQTFVKWDSIHIWDEKGR